MKRVKAKGIEAILDAAAWKGSDLYFLSIIGPRESVRAILATWASHGEVLVDGKPFPHPPAWGERKHRVVRLAGKAYHGMGWVPGLYYARERDDRKERLWLSRQLEVPIPEEVWERARARVALASYRMVALNRPGHLEEGEILRAIGLK